MEIEKCLEDYISYLKYEKAYSRHTIDAYKRDINDFILFLLSIASDPIHPQQISKGLGRKYVEYLNVEKKLKSSTISRKIYALSSYLSFLEIEGVIENNPFQKLEMPKKLKTLPVYLNSDELDKLILVTEKHSNAVNGIRDLICISILRFTGCRRNELLCLKWKDIDTNMKSIRFLGKGNKERLVPIHPVLKDYLLCYKSQVINPKEGLIIKGQNENRLSDSGFRKILNKYLKLAGLDGKNITPHKIRHSFATELLSKGVDIRIIQQWLGHENISTTAIYTHVTLEHLSSVWRDSYDDKKEIED